jgi:hypothetical protein
MGHGQQRHCCGSATKQGKSVAEEDKKKFDNFWAWIATAFWVIFWAVMLLGEWPQARLMKFNEWGDFFAGVFAPLAFLWLIVGYRQQAHEIGQNREALLLQAKELNNSVAQQKEMNRLTQEGNQFQRDMASHERKLRKGEAAPHFRLIRGFLDTSGRSVPTFVLVLKNVGADISSVDVHQYDATRGIVVMGISEKTSTKPIWKRDEDFTIYVEVSSFGYGEGFSLELVYLDGISNKETQVLSFMYVDKDTGVVFNNEPKGHTFE